MEFFIKIKNHHLDEIVEIHLKAFPNFFLTSLGSEFLLLFYSCLLKDKNTLAWAIKKDNNIIGFFFATKYAKGVYFRMIKKSFLRFIIVLFLRILRNPSLLSRFLISAKSSNNHVIPVDCYATLLSICVNPEDSGRGYGKLLLGKLEEEFILSNILSYYLTTDSFNNNSTNLFYENNKFELYSNFWQGKRKMNLFLKNLK